jgi:hypothetical protein
MHLLGESSGHRQWYGQKPLTIIVRKIKGRVVKQASKKWAAKEVSSKYGTILRTVEKSKTFISGLELRNS